MLKPIRLLAVLLLVLPLARLHAAEIRVQAGPPDTTAAGPAAYRPFLDAGVDVLATDFVPGAAIATQGVADAR